MLLGGMVQIAHAQDITRPGVETDNVLAQHLAARTPVVGRSALWSSVRRGRASAWAGFMRVTWVPWGFT